jgi:SPP1 family predicted phage head-tail adaptor
MRAGPLDRRVTIQQPIEAQDSAGAVTLHWADVATVWAQRQDVRAREYVSGNVMLAEVEAVFRLRHRSDVAPRWRLVSEGSTWDITGVTQLGRRDGIELRCVAAQEG